MPRCCACPHLLLTPHLPFACLDLADCPYKHSLEAIKECNMYKLGFCIYGPAVSYTRSAAWS